MPGTPPLGPAALPRVVASTRRARRAVLLWVRAIAVAAAVALAALAALAAGPARADAPASCPGAAERLGAAPAAAVQAAVVCLVNAERAAAGLAPVRGAGALEASARRHAADMVARRYFAHVSPSGGTVDKRARRAGYLTAPCWVLGEDLARAPSAVASADAVVRAWMASPKHRAVILDAEFRDAGIGLVPPAPGGDGATFVLELGAMTACGPTEATGTVRATPRARIRVG